MLAVKCDKCGSKISGSYKKVLDMEFEGMATGKQEICLKCWKAFESMARIPIYPNTEEKK